MTNTEMLLDLILKSGKPKTFLAEKLGLTRQGFELKLKGVHEFKASEIAILCNELGITSLKEKERIFFAQKVSKSFQK